ncbi:MAG: hypothetical protein Q9M45_03230 [Robiginitomaculum sp.]|nr:hypothetical protein [Robiginitomaculum sp.]
MADSNTGTIETSGNLLFYKKPEPLNSDVHGNLGITPNTVNPFAFAKKYPACPRYGC